MKILMPILMTIFLVACVGSSAVKRPIAVYDFGLAGTGDAETGQRILARVDVESVTAAEALNYQQMRYRLAYENPARVFFYTENRWASPPAELVSNKLNGLLETDKGALNCSLKLRLDIFDQVFSSPVASEGVVQMNAVLVDKKTRRTLATHLASARATANTQNAQGGADALARATSTALLNAINWANDEAAKNQACQYSSLQ